MSWKYEQEKVLKEPVVASLEVISHHLPEEAEVNVENLKRNRQDSNLCTRIQI
jgi:hypothetical protein